MEPLRCWPRVWCYLRTDPRFWAGGCVVCLIVSMAATAPLIAPYDPLTTAPARQLLPPSVDHPAGTDLLGRDVWSRLIWGGRLSLTAGAIATALAVLPGSLLGLLAGYVGGKIDSLLMRIVDMALAFPTLLLALTIVSALGTGLTSAALAVGCAGIPRFARVVRAATLGVRYAPFIEAARTVGCRPYRILLRHIAPFVADTVVVLASLELGYALLNIGALSFLGLGAQSPAPEWGLMLTEGRAYLSVAPWITAAPGCAITLTVLAVNLLGDALRDALGLQVRD
ncbi:MAG: peptide ABC transporter permease [Ardenticatenia bacterium]|nr:MAG: peptide ABC transporter permease [Ardenticatenia bacterium]